MCQGHMIGTYNIRGVSGVRARVIVYIIVILSRILLPPLLKEN